MIGSADELLGHRLMAPLVQRIASGMSDTSDALDVLRLMVALKEALDLLPSDHWTQPLAYGASILYREADEASSRALGLDEGGEEDGLG